jgi:hypothetical protein
MLGPSGTTLLPEQRRFLDKRLLDHARKQPEIMDVKDILLSIAGEHVVAPPRITEDTFRIAESGFLMEYPVTTNLMEPHMCHLNSARLIASGEATGLCTGYALFKGLWREHSWAVKRQEDGTNHILETTGSATSFNDKYFGIFYWGVMALLVARHEFQFNGVKLPAAFERLEDIEAGESGDIAEVMES